MSTRKAIFMAAVERAWEHPTMSEATKMATIILAFEISAMQAKALEKADSSPDEIDKDTGNQRTRTRILCAIIRACEVAGGYAKWPGLANLVENLRCAGLAVANRCPVELGDILHDLQKIPTDGTNLHRAITWIRRESESWIEPASTATRYGLWYVSKSPDDDADWKLMKELVRMANCALPTSENAMRLRGVE